MVKRSVKVIALVLALVLLSGCSLSESDLSGSFDGLLSRITDRSDYAHNPGGVMFSDMRYARPDTKKLADDVAAVKDALDSGVSLKGVERLLDVCMDDYDDFSTMYSLANIYNCKDLRDEFYAAEYEWISAESAEVSRLFDEMYYACAGSALGPQLERDYFWEGFCEDYANPEDSYYNDKTVALMQRESELISQYREITADPTVMYKGREVSFYDLLEELGSAEDEASLYLYLTVLVNYYQKYSGILGRIYIDLMRVRCEMAEEMGFSSCEEMEYVYGFGRDYTPQDAAVFINEIKTRIVPISRWAESSGLSAEEGYSALSTEALFAGLQAITDDIGGDCSEAFSFMSRYGLCDIEPSNYKAETSFLTYLSKYDSPFIFLKPTETTRDLMTFVHEFGHFTDSYVNFDAAETIDLAEVFSQALEFLSLSHMDGVLPESEIKLLRKSELLDALDTFTQQAAFADFESKVYALGPDQLTAEKLSELYLQSLEDFGACPAGYEFLYRYGWMDTIHLFEYPFYVISYPVSLAVAMQIYELETQQPGLGMEKYFEILPRDYDSFMDTVSNGGLKSPFDEGSLASVAALIGDALGYKGTNAKAA